MKKLKMAGDIMFFETIVDGIPNKTHHEIIGNHENMVSQDFGVLTDVG
ncbi:conserved hypothetical protein [Xenorhabdus szentirmaii DSM 16338]|uniref:Uncharacterized protein n=1 Tax=Xenorhabdus szentirmaii DSM 16338 TaxID=1427518 RepID=W1J285_9GAMM|nr:conserved hypothetical protein [Xenorhabdus szentirmaii DSM 16338]